MQHRALMRFKDKLQKKYQKTYKNLENGEKNFVIREIIWLNLNVSEGQPNSIFLELKRQLMFT